MRRVWFLLLLGACGDSVSVPDGAAIRCVDDANCPARLVCDLEALLCVEPGAPLDRSLNLTLVELTPEVAGGNDVVAIEIEATRALNQCRASFGALGATCAIGLGEPERCRCSAAVNDAVPEGEVVFVVDAIAGPLGGQLTTSVRVEKRGPEVDPSGIRIIRRAAGSPDALELDRDAFRDPPPAYAGQGVATIRIWPDARSDTPLQELTLAADLPSSLVVDMGSAEQAPKTVWVSAVDSVGNEGARVEVLQGKDERGPELDGSRLRLTLRTDEATRSLLGEDGAARDEEGSAVLRFEIYEGSEDSSPAASTNATAAFGFARISLAPSGRERPYVVAIDKAGNRSDPVRPRRVDAVLTTAGRTPGDRSVPRIEARAFAWDQPNTPFFVPLRPQPTITPPVIATLSDELSADHYDELARDDGVDFNAQTDAAAAVPRGWALSFDMPAATLAGAFAFDTNRNTAVAYGGVAIPPDFELTLTTLSELGTLGISSTTLELGPSPATEWQVVSTANSPSPLVYAAMAYDASRKKMVLFGGLTDSLDIEGCEVGGVCGNTWEYDGNQWLQVFPENSPSPRAGATMAFDPVNDRILLFGGISAVERCGESASSGNYCSDLWSFDGVDWTPVAALSPPAGRGYAKMVYDPWTLKMLVWGGADRIQDHFCGGDTPPRCDDLIAFNGIGWKTLFTGTPPIAQVLADEQTYIPTEAAFGLNVATRELVAYDFFLRTCSGEAREPFAWNCGVLLGSPVALTYQFIGYDPSRDGVLMRYETLDAPLGRWTVFRERPGAQRSQALMFELTLEPEAKLVDVRLEIDASADSPAATGGYRAQIWNFGSRSWIPGEPEFDVTEVELDRRTLQADVFVLQGGKAYLLLSSQPTELGQSTPSSLSVDYGALTVSYELPE